MIKASIKNKGIHKAIQVKIVGDEFHEVLEMLTAIIENVSRTITGNMKDETEMIFARTALYQDVRNAALDIGKQIAKELGNIEQEEWEKYVHPKIRKEIEQFKKENTIQAAEEDLRKRIIESIMPKGRMGEEQE